MQFWLFVAAIVLFLLILGIETLNSVAKQYKAISEFIGPLGTPIIALIAAYIAYQQHLTSRKQLQLERYDRQVRVYTATQEFLLAVISSDDGRVGNEIFNTFNQSLSESHFIFDGDDVPSFLETLRRKYTGYAARYRQLNRTSLSSAKRDQAEAEVEKLYGWFDEQYRIETQALFKKHLKLR